MADLDSIKDIESFMENAVGTIVDRSVSGVSGFGCDVMGRADSDVLGRVMGRTDSDVVGRAVSDILRPFSFMSGLDDGLIDHKLDDDDDEASVPMTATFPALNREASIDLALASRVHCEPGTVQLRAHRVRFVAAIVAVPTILASRKQRSPCCCDRDFQPVDLARQRM
jgi:hypothetical protein